jgi:hypothetical protein
MNPSDRNKIDWSRFTILADYRIFLQGILKGMLDTFETKNAEYCGSEDNVDVFSNFRKTAQLEGTSVEFSLITKVSKHIIALIDFVKMLEEGKVMPLWQWQEKCGDIRTYATLLEGIITLEHQAKE